MAIELYNIELTFNAQFYKLNKNLSTNLVKNVFKKIKDEKIPKPNVISINNNIRNNKRRKDIFISVFVYSIEKTPSFLKNVNYKEKKYSYIVLIEMYGMLVISKLNAPDMGKYFPNNIKYLAHEEVSNVFSNDEPVYNKLNTSSTSLVDTGVKNTIYEGNNLKNGMNAYGVQQSIANSFNVKTNDSKLDDNAINPNTRRIKTKSIRTDLNSFIEWAEKVIYKLNQPKKETFLDSFASPINYEEIKNNKLSSTGILLKLESLENKLYSEDNTFELKYKKTKDKFIKINESRYKPFLEKAKNSFLVDNDSFEFDKFNISLVYNNNKIKLYSDELRKVYLFNQNSNKPQNIESYFNGIGYFALIFDDPKYIYNKHQLYYDEGILNNIDSLLKILESNRYLEQVTNEKLYCDNKKNEPIDKSITSFDEKTLFNVVEKKIFDKGHLICDDLGDEWADHIHLKNDEESPEIIFYISKYGETSTKASSLHEVLGQVSKNIGNIKFDKEMFEKKIITWKNNWSGTQLNRLRSAKKDWNIILNDAEELISNPKTIRTLCVVTTLLSYTQLKNELNDFKDGTNKRKHLPQLMWFLSSYVHACMVNNIKPRIICKR